MEYTMNENMAAEIKRINVANGNVEIDPTHFQNLTYQSRSEFNQIGSEFATSSYVFNLTDSPIAYSRRDGVVTPVAPLNATRMYGNLLTQHNNCIIVVEVRTVDLELFDPNIGRLMEHDARIRHSNTDAAESACVFGTNINSDGHEQFPYQKDMEAMIRRRLTALKAKDSHGLSFDDNEFIADHRSDTSFKCTTVYKISADSFQGRDVYVPHIDMIFRKLNNTQAIHRTRKRDIPYEKIDVIQNTPLKHPLTAMDTISMIRGINQALANYTHVGLIRVQQWKNRSTRTNVFLVRNKEIIQLDLKQVDNKEDEGIFITEKNENGTIAERRDDISEIDKYNLHWTYEEAEAANTLLSREKDIAEEKIRIEKVKIEADQAEAQAKQQASADKIRDAEAAKVKGELNNKSDALRLFGQVVGVIAAIATCVVTLVKLFSPSRFFSGLFGQAA